MKESKLVKEVDLNSPEGGKKQQHYAEKL